VSAVRVAWTPGQYAILRLAAAAGLALVPPGGEAWIRAAYWSALLFVPFRRTAIAALFAICLLVRMADFSAPAQDLAHTTLCFAALFGVLQVAGGLRHPGLLLLPMAGPLFAALLWSSALPAGSWRLVGLIAVPVILTIGWIWPPARLPLWLSGIALGIGLAAGGHPPAAEAWILHALALQPSWIPRRAAASQLTVYYDGGCGFCHRGVRFLIEEDPAGAALRFAPLQGASFAAAVPERERAELPDSIVVREADGALHLRSAAALRVGAALGGYWRPLAALGRLVPRALRDAAYDAIALRRARWFARPAGLCPLLTPAQRERFDP
jgi:predicted DCC family thiol-disulfide oxidoreductase YuxK